jgi:outer membrane protein OmpA-like peptidoglycan-associated protein
VGAALALPAVSHAQTHQSGGDVELDEFRPAIDSKGFITVNASEVLASMDLSFGLVSDWGYKVLKLNGPAWPQPMYAAGNTSYHVDNVLSPQLQAAFGLFKVAEVGVGIPFRVVSGKSDPSYTGTPGDPRDDKDFNFSSQGIGDISLHAKVRFLDSSHAPVGLAVMGSVYIPAGYDKQSWLGDGDTSFRLTGIVDTQTLRFHAGVNAGIYIRSKQHEFDDTPITTVTPNIPGTGDKLVAQNEIPFGVAVSYAVSIEKIDLIAEVFGSVPLDATNYFPVEAIAGVKFYLAHNSYLLLGGGGGLGSTAGKGGSPLARAFIGIVFEPSIGDRDHDGIKDDVDKCPDEPEDKDGFEDEDGCPDPDNDHDGIPDELDKCPNDPETFNGYQDADGCPDTVVADRDGDGIPDDVDKCPDEPEDKDGFQDADGCPDPDNDGDGIPDVDDACPNDPEDFDGFQDADGCPDPDNDHDGIPDKLDKCPNQPEDFNGYQDEDGCPDKGRVIVHQGSLEILDKVYFETDKAIIKPESFPILDAVAATMKGNPDIQLIEVQGHADERGSASHNLKLTDDRAHSVENYLVEHGVDPGRLDAHGYGVTRPIDPGHNEAAWSKNRRVEFVIKKRGGGAVPPSP